jgi:hypothetical protein
MKLAEQQNIREKTSALLLEWAAERQPPFTGETTEGFADAIVAAHVVADEGRLNLHRWTDAARRAGLSWAEIGEALGISKQAAQQRFRAASEDIPEAEDGVEIVRLGATAFNEMSILREEGLKGNELVRTGVLTLVFRRSGQPWEYRRLLGAASMMPDMKREGWTHVSSWLPFHYFKRPLQGE